MGQILVLIQSVNKKGPNKAGQNDGSQKVANLYIGNIKTSSLIPMVRIENYLATMVTM